MCLVHKAHYGLPGSGHACWLKLSEMLRDVKFTPNRGDSEIWFRLNSKQEGYDYIGTHTDDLMIVAKEVQPIMDGLQEY